MSLLICTDLHLTGNIKDEYRWDFTKWFIRKANSYSKCDILILGDLCQDKDNHNAHLTNRVADFIRELSVTHQVFILKGNHDYIDSECPFFRFLDHINNVKWINKPTQITVSTYDCLFLPHTRDYKQDWKGILHHPYDLIFAHNTFEGVSLKGGHKLSGIPQNIFPKSASVFSGDIHIPQELETVTYVGAPYRINYGDDYIPRILLIDEVSNGYEWIGVPGPYKYLLEIKTLADLKKNQNLRKGDMLKIKVDLTPEEFDNWQETKSSIRKWCDDKGYRVELVQPQVKIRRVRKSATSNRKTDKEILQEYAKRRSISDQFLKAGLEFIEEDSIVGR